MSLLEITTSYMTKLQAAISTQGGIPEPCDGVWGDLAKEITPLDLAVAEIRTRTVFRGIWSACVPGTRKLAAEFDWESSGTLGTQSNMSTVYVAVDPVSNIPAVVSEVEKKISELGGYSTIHVPYVEGSLGVHIYAYLPTCSFITDIHVAHPFEQMEMMTNLFILAHPTTPGRTHALASAGYHDYHVPLVLDNGRTSTFYTLAKELVLEGKSKHDLYQLFCKYYPGCFWRLADFY